MYYLLLIITGFVSLNAKHDKLFPKYDKRCDAMKVQHAPVDSVDNLEHVDYFSKEVPRFVHQIWFGDPDKMPKDKINDWREYVGMNRYHHKLWTEKDLPELKSFMKPENYTSLLIMLKEKNYTAASDIVRLEILKELGGCYFDCDFSPPRKKKDYVLLDQILTMKGLTVVSEHQGRNIGETALFVCNGILISPPEHPVIVSAVDQITGNLRSYYQKTKTHDAMFATGPFFFNKVLWGTYNVMPITYLKQFKMY